MGAGGSIAAVLTGLPLLVVPIGMPGLRWSAARAGCWGAPSVSLAYTTLGGLVAAFPFA